MIIHVQVWLFLQIIMTLDTPLFLSHIDIGNVSFDHPSACPSVCFVPVLYQNSLMYCHTFFSPVILVFQILNIFTKFWQGLRYGCVEYRLGLNVTILSNWPHSSRHSCKYVCCKCFLPVKIIPHEQLCRHEICAFGSGCHHVSHMLLHRWKNPLQKCTVVTLGVMLTCSLVATAKFLAMSWMWCV